MPDTTGSPLFHGSQFLRLALRGVVLAYVTAALFFIAIEFAAAVPSVSLAFGIAFVAGFAVLEAALIFNVLQIFKSISG